MNMMDPSRGSSAVFPMPQIPTLFFPPPPPAAAAAALQSSSLSLSSTSSSPRHAPSITSFPLLVLTVLGILTTSVLLLAYYVFVIRCCLTWHHRGRGAGSSSDVSRRRGPQRNSTTTSDSSAPAPAEPRGLEDAAIRALPAFTYRRKKPAASECAVCLGELEEGDRVRMLPACLHAFHVACIDAWLQGNANCPLCRADVAAHCLPPPPPPLEEEQEVVVVIQIPGGAAEEDHQDTPPQQQQQEAVVAPAEFEEEDTTGSTGGRQVGSEKKAKGTINGCHDIGITIAVTAKTKEPDVLPPTPMRSRSLSMMDSSMAGGEVRLQIHNALHHTDRDDRDSDSSGGGRVC